MMLNYLSLAFQTTMIGIPGVPAKLITESLLFILSYIVKKLFVFRHRGRDVRRLLKSGVLAANRTQHL